MKNTGNNNEAVKEDEEVIAVEPKIRRGLTKKVFYQVISDSWLFMASGAIETIVTALVYPSAAALIFPVHPSDSDWHTIYFSQVRKFQLMSKTHNFEIKIFYRLHVSSLSTYATISVEFPVHIISK